MPKSLSTQSSLVAFEDQKIRRTWHDNAWWFSITDVVAVLTESANARRYWSDLKRKIEEEQGGNELYEKIVQLKLPSADGKLADVAPTLLQLMGMPKPEVMDGGSLIVE